MSPSSRTSFESVLSSISEASSAPSVASSRSSVDPDHCDFKSCTVCPNSPTRPSLTTDFIALPALPPVPSTFDDLPKPLRVRKRRAEPRDNPFRPQGPRCTSLTFQPPRSVSGPPPPKRTETPAIEVFSPWDTRMLPSLFVATPTRRVPPPSLRHKRSPRRLSLRELRAKESEACLQRAYEDQTMAYLNDSISPSPGPRLNHLRRQLAPTPESWER